LRLHDPERRKALIQQVYEEHHGKHSSKYDVAVDGARKIDFFRTMLKQLGVPSDALGVDLGCRGAVVTRELLDLAQWCGVDIDREAIARANAAGVPCVESDISTSLDFVDSAFDLVMMTEVMEHLPYPTVTVREVHRILKKSGGIFLGSVPLEYNLNRRWRVARGKRLEHDPTHLHQFSFKELDALLRQYFEEVAYQPLRGLPVKFPQLKCRSYNLWVRDIAWVAWKPKARS